MLSLKADAGALFTLTKKLKPGFSVQSMIGTWILVVLVELLWTQEVTWIWRWLSARSLDSNNLSANDSCKTTLALWDLCEVCSICHCQPPRVTGELDMWVGSLIPFYTTQWENTPPTVMGEPGAQVGALIPFYLTQWENTGNVDHIIRSRTHLYILL